MTRRFPFLPAAVLPVLAVSAALPPSASAETGPSGWRTEAVGKNAVMTPPDLAPGEFYQIIVFPRTSQDGAAITGFLDGFADRTVAALGKPGIKPEPARATGHSSATTARTFVTEQGQARMVIFTALCLDGDTVRVVAVACSQDIALLNRYQSQLGAVLKEMVRQETEAAVASGRGLQTETVVQAPDGMTPGGKIVPGIYAGNTVRTDDHEIIARYRLYLYADGEYRLCDSAGRDIDYASGPSFYDPITGQLKIGSYIHMSNFKDPADGFCLYGRGADGKPYLHAQQNATYGRWTTLLRYAGPPDKPSLAQEQAAKAAAEAEAQRFKYVTAPGKGVQPAQIAAILVHFGIQIGSIPAGMDKYLLLKDGTIHDGLQVPPDELDVPLSRRREPEKWGRWRKQGGDYLAAWPDRPGHFESLQASPVYPAKPGQHLSGHFERGMTIGDPATGSSTLFWGVTFTPGGRFVKDHSGSTFSGSLGQTLNGFSVSTGYDDDSSYTSVSAPNFAGGSETKKKGSSRAGTYSVSGYTLTLHYDDGHTDRLPFFFATEKRDFLYFEGSMLNLENHK